MKIKNLVFLSCVLSMPMQQALAESAKGFVPASASKSKVATPQKAPAISNGRTLRGPVSIAGPGSRPSSSVLKPTVAGGVNAVVSPMLKPNLVIHSVGLSDEICSDTCAPTLRELGLGRPCSPIRIYIKNTGTADAGSFKIHLRYSPYGGSMDIYAPVSGLARGQGKYVVLNSVKTYKLNKPFTVRVDINNTVNESNENDNQKTVYFR